MKRHGQVSVPILCVHLYKSLYTWLNLFRIDKCQYTPTHSTCTPLSKSLYRHLPTLCIGLCVHLYPSLQVSLHFHLFFV